jgi:hypothetical protein
MKKSPKVSPTHKPIDFRPHQVGICWLPYIDNSAVRFEKCPSYFVFLKRERFKAILVEVEYKVSLQEIGANHLFHDIVISFAAEEHLKTVMPRHLIHPVVITKITEIGEATAIKTHGSFIFHKGTVKCLRESIS